MNDEHLFKNPVRNDVTISFPPPITCYYLIGGERLKLGLTKKPSWFHRFMMKFAFGIEFEEIKK